MTVEIISIATKVLDRAGIELATPGSAARPAYVTRHATDSAMRLSGRVLDLSLGNRWFAS